jgi:hypothetical protein
VTTFTNLSDSTLEQDKPVTQSVMRALRDNPKALAEGDATAPEVVGVSPLDVQLASGSAALVFDNLPSGYDILEFDIVRLSPVTVTNQLIMEVSVDNGTTWLTSNYEVAWTTITGGTSGTAASSASNIPVTENTTFFTTAPSTVVNGRVRTHNFSLPVSRKFVRTDIFWINSSPNQKLMNLMGYINGDGTLANAINAVRFRFTTGNISSGYIAMRRVRPS